MSQERYCFTHGTYWGGTCAHCEAEKRQRKAQEHTQRIAEQDRRHREELTQRQEDALWEAEERRERHLAEAEARQRENLANAWRFEAQTQTDRGFELYNAEAFDDAFRLFQKAIAQDPSNIRPFLGAAWTLEKQGRPAEAREYYDKQITLLRTGECRDSPNVHLTVLRGLPNQEEGLIQAFSTVLRENGQRWDASAASLELLDEVIQRRLLDSAEQAVGVWARKTDSLLLQTYLLEIHHRRGEPLSDTSLRTFLESVPPERRLNVIGQWNQVGAVRGRFSDSVANTVRGRLRERLAQWTPRIAAEVAERTYQTVKQAGASGSAVIAFLIVGSLATMGAWLLASMHDRALLMNLGMFFREDLEPSGGQVWLGLALGIVLGTLAGSSFEAMVVSVRWRRLRQSSWNAEWGQALKAGLVSAVPEFPAGVLSTVNRRRLRRWWPLFLAALVGLSWLYVIERGPLILGVASSMEGLWQGQLEYPGEIFQRPPASYEALLRLAVLGIDSLGGELLLPSVGCLSELTQAWGDATHSSGGFRRTVAKRYVFYQRVVRGQASRGCLAHDFVVLLQENDSTINTVFWGNPKWPQVRERDPSGDLRMVARATLVRLSGDERTQ